MSRDDPIEIRRIDELTLRPAVRHVDERPAEQRSRDRERRKRQPAAPVQSEQSVSADHVDVRA